MPQRAPTQRFLVVDAMRGMAALGVVVYHLTAGDHIPLLAKALPAWIVAVINHGNLGVPIFFVLSGFVIAHSLHSEKVTPSLAGRFMLRRSLRLDPPYWTAIAVTLAFSVLSALAVPGKLPPAISGAQIAAHMFYLQDVLGFPEINSVFWTLCMEVQFYIVYVVMLAATRNDPARPRQGRSTIAILALAAVSSVLWPSGLVTYEPWHGSFLPFWHGFLLGVGAYWAWRHAELRACFAGFAVSVAAISIMRSEAFSLTCAITAALLVTVAMAGRITSSLNWAWLQFLGAISYSLYLVHNPITGASFRVGHMLVGDTMRTEIILTAVALAASILTAAAVFYLVERPSMKIARLIYLRPSRSQRLGGTVALPLPSAPASSR